MRAETHPSAARPVEAADRPLVGWALTAVAALHLGLAPLFYGEALRSITDAGVFASVEADPKLIDLRSSGFWYVSAGGGLLILGLLTLWTERETGSLPSFLGWAFLGLAAWGLVLMPVSGFWAVLVVAGLALRSSRRRASSTGSAQAQRPRLPSG